jgi:hypothetical protein
MAILNPRPSFFETPFTLLFESEDHFLRRHSNRNYARHKKQLEIGTNFFCILDKNMQAKIK